MNKMWNVNVYPKDTDTAPMIQYKTNTDGIEVYREFCREHHTVFKSYFIDSIHIEYYELSFDDLSKLLPYALDYLESELNFLDRDEYPDNVCVSISERLDS